MGATGGGQRVTAGSGMDAAAAANERAQLAKLCSSRDWSKAIRVLDSLLARSCTIQDICNRAFCYSQLELHKHVVKDCDKALHLDSKLVQAYILKGHALSALGRKDEAVLVWQHGYACALQEPMDLKQLLEFEELLGGAKQIKANIYDDHLMDAQSAITTVSDTYSDIDIKSNGAYEIESPPSWMSEKCNQSNGSNSMINAGTKNILKANTKTKSISLDFRLSRGIAQVNEGKYEEAISFFNQILKENRTSPEALIGRGTAHAFKRELEAAIADFSMAIDSNPVAGEAWKRRGQARAALGEYVEAIEDITKALDFEPNSTDILHDRGIVNFKFKDYIAAVDDLSLCVKHEKNNKSSYTYLGLALSALGEYVKAEKAHLKSIEIDGKFLDGWAHLVQFYKDLANHEKAMKSLEQILYIDGRFPKAYYLRGLLYHGMGQHRDAIKDLSIVLTIEPSNIECLYLRGSCFHAVGEYGDAIKDYDAVLDLELDSMDKFVLQCLAFYQKEISLYTASKVNSEFWLFDIDGDIDPLFKEYWCKRLHPKYVCEKVYRQTPLIESLKRGRLKKQDFLTTKNKTNLIQAADIIGSKIQYNCPGFLPNRRQYRMAGLAAIEIAQKVIKSWRALQADWRSSGKNINKNSKKARRKEKLNITSQNRGGAGCSTSSTSETLTCEEKSIYNRFMSWQDVYSIAVKWRQISEPCDPVVWVNKLSEEFNSGFGSHTPMLLGQSKVVRYFSNYDRALGTAKAIMKETMCAYNAEDKMMDLSDPANVQKIMNAEGCSDLFNIVGESFWVSTSCCSLAFDGKKHEGTRITTQKMDKGFDFAIRTPCTPSRWKDYDAEMTVSWEVLCSAYCGEAYGSTDLGMLDNVKEAILRMTFYWYNFMPLSRGTAAVGYVVLLGLFLAANMEVTASIPQGVQVDWEAILSSHPDTFVDSIKVWLYPSLMMNTAWRDLPDVSSTLATTGSVISSLSNYDN